MEKRTLGKTGMDVSVLSFGASSLGAEFRKIAGSRSRCLVSRSMELIATAIICVRSWDAMLQLILISLQNGFGKASTSLWSE